MTLDYSLVSRELLKSLRNVIGMKGSVGERLSEIVKLIAQKLRAEVCSCYVMRRDDVLELYATYGLSSEAVHATRLKVGEGLVGLVAQNIHSVALADAWSHPKFAYRPETKEEIYHSFLGVPLVLQGEVCGVLVIQNEKERQYQDLEIEALETVSMVLSEMLFNDKDIRSLKEEKNASNSINITQCSSLSSGISIGKVFIHEEFSAVAQIKTDNVEKEKQRLKQALEKMNKYLDKAFSQEHLGHGEHLEIIETYKMFAKDDGWIRKISQKIEQENLTAEASVQRVYDEMWIQMSAITDDYIKERIYDFKDLTDRLLGYLIGRSKQKENQKLPQDVILVSKSLGPAQLLDYDRKKIRGIVLVEGTPTMHVAIIARSMNIPVISNIENIIDLVENDDEVIVDGNHGQIFIRPNKDIVKVFYQRFFKKRKHEKELATLKDYPNITLDGYDFQLSLNAGLTIDLDYLEHTNAHSIGLYRTEIPFLIRNQMPTVETQTRLYSSIVEKAKGKSVIFRTLDIGADKILSYWDNPKEDNPAMGWRSIRIALDRRVVLRQQLRAMIRASIGKELNVMFPMVSEISELIEAKEALEKEAEKEKKETGKEPRKINVGTMIEVPSLVYQLESMFKYIDFVSLGTNDLFQFFYACDRGNPKLTGRYDTLSPSFLSFLKEILEKCKYGGVDCSICGEMAGNPIDALALLGLGYNKFSVSGAMFLDVKNTLRSVKYLELEKYINSILSSEKHSLRTEIRSFAVKNNIKI